MTVSIAFTKDFYSPVEPIEFQVVVTDEPTQVLKSVTFEGSVTLLGQQVVPVSGVTSTRDEVTYGEFAADGYTVEQDPADPTRYTATPL